MSVSANVWRADVRLRASRTLLGLTVALHLAAAAAVAIAYAPLGVKLLAWALLPPHAWWSLRSVRLERPGSVVAFREYGDDWWLETAGGQGLRVLLLPELALWRHLLVLRFAELTPEGPGRRYHVAVLRDSLPAEGFRRLYVRLRFRKTFTATDDDNAAAPEREPHDQKSLVDQES